MDAKNTCDGRRNDRSHMDYQGADGVQDAFSIVRVHDLTINAWFDSKTNIRGIISWC